MNLKSKVCKISEDFYPITTNHYTDNELDLYSTYMNEIREIVKTKDLPEYVMCNMLWGKTLHKNNDAEWYLENEGYKVYFISFRMWLQKEIREEQLNKLGI